MVKSAECTPHHFKSFRVGLLLIVFQLLYVVLDLVEATTLNSLYGLLAGVFMILFGILICAVVLQTYIVQRPLKMNRHIKFEFMEGFVYISLGTAISVVRWSNRHLISEEDKRTT
jgi:uncharacterized membrane protein required for colicin V production